MRPTSSAAIVRASNTQAFLVTNLTNIYYITGVHASYAVVLCTARNILLFVDSRYSEAAQKNAYTYCTVRPIEDLPKYMAKVQQCGFEADTMTIAQLAQWKRKNKNTKFVQKIGIIEKFRRTKGADELQTWRKAQRITQKLLQEVPQYLQWGTTEQQLAEMLRHRAVEMGAESLSFDPIVAYGPNSSRPHHSPSAKKLTKNSIIQIDIGARVGGYCADQSQIFFTGAKTAKQEKAYQAVAEAKAAAIAIVKPGVTNHALYNAVCAVLEQYTMRQYFTHSLGHGVGLDIHEGANISNRAPECALEGGEIITIEPGVYFPGEFGIRLEEEVIVL